MRFNMKDATLVSIIFCNTLKILINLAIYFGCNAKLLHQPQKLPPGTTAHIFKQNIPLLNAKFSGGFFEFWTRHIQMCFAMYFFGGKYFIANKFSN